MRRLAWWSVGVVCFLLWTAVMFQLGEYVGLREHRGGIEVISVPAKGK